MHQDLFIRTSKSLLKINSQDILLIESSGNYSKIIVNGGHYLVNTTLARLENELLPKDLFCRVHRSYIVSLSQINSISTTTDLINLGNLEVPFSKAYENDLISRLRIIR